MDGRLVACPSASKLCGVIKAASYRPLLGGILFAAVLAAIAYTVNTFAPLLSALLVAIILGVVTAARLLELVCGDDLG